MINLKTPPEPVELKQKALKEAESESWRIIDREGTISLFVLGARGLPKYLWDYWKPELKALNIPWQSWLSIISACRYDVIRWVEGQKTWEELIDIIKAVLEKAKKGKYPLWPP
mgnify:CR=1 FL=1